MTLLQIRFILCVLLICPVNNAWSQQIADTLFAVTIGNPAYEKGKGSIVIIDEAHTNFHTRNGRYKPFANVLEQDGYAVHAGSSTFTKEQFGAVKILVIANALHPSNATQWSLPTPSAFTDEEIQVVNSWVKDGGSLFLIADHMPFPGAAEKLAASFGFKFYNGFASRKGLGGNDIFTFGNGMLKSSIITKGRNKKETITSLQSFTGQAFEIPQDANPVIVLDSKFEIKMPMVAGAFDKNTPTISAENFVQGAFMRYGNGRVVIFGEAAMFTAQLQGKNKMGMNQKSAFQNAQFLLNVIHWLDGILE